MVPPVTGLSFLRLDVFVLSVESRRLFDGRNMIPAASKARQNMLLVIIRRHRSTTYVVDVAYCYRPSSVVGRSVGQSVTLVSPAKTAEPIEMLPVRV